jgi:hypothetical protein
MADYACSSNFEPCCGCNGLMIYASASAFYSSIVANRWRQRRQSGITRSTIRQ